MKVNFRSIRVEAMERYGAVPARSGPPGTRMIICECTGTTDGTIRALARDGVTKVSEVTRRCGAGGCCQSCRPAIARILRATAATAAAVAKEEATVAELLVPEVQSVAL